MKANLIWIGFVEIEAGLAKWLKYRHSRLRLKRILR